MEYTVRQFRKSLKEALDKVDAGESVHIRRNGTIYTINGRY